MGNTEAASWIAMDEIQRDPRALWRGLSSALTLALGLASVVRSPTQRSTPTFPPQPPPPSSPSPPVLRTARPHFFVCLCPRPCPPYILSRDAIKDTGIRNLFLPWKIDTGLQRLLSTSHGPQPSSPCYPSRSPVCYSTQTILIACAPHIPC